MRTALFSIAALLATTTLAAAGETEIEQAKTYFNAGRTAYEAGLYEAAISAFEEAYRLAPRPPVLFSLAQAYRQQYLSDRDPGRLSRAIDLFRQYLDQMPKGGRRDHARQHLADLEKELKVGPLPKAPPRPTETKTQLMVTSRTAGALASVDDDEPVEVPVMRDLPAGPHKVRVDADGHIGEELVAVAVEGRLVVTEVNLREKPAAIALRAPEGSEIVVDGRVLGEAPMPPIEVSSGRHVIAVLEPGRYGWARELELGRGENIEVEANLETTHQRTISYLFLGTSALATAGAVITGVIALGAQRKANDLDDKRLSRQGLTAEDLEDYQSARARRNTLAPTSAALFAGGVASGVTGLLLYLLDSPRVTATSGGISAAF
jgi:tetratricopeptide (TPR) repeat protein